MAAVGVGTYSAAVTDGNREDLSDIIRDVSPYDTPLYSMIPTVKAKSVNHEWLTKSLASPNADNKALQGEDLGVDTTQTRVRLGNYTQIFTQSIIISDTQEAVDKAGVTSEVDLQVADRMKEIKTDLDTRLADNNVKVAPTNIVEGEIGGIQTYMRTNVEIGAGGSLPTGNSVDALTPGTTRPLTETLFKAALVSQYNAGGNASMVLLSGFNKQKFSTFSGGSTRFSADKDATLVATVDVYRSDFGPLKVLPSRHVTATMLIIDPELVAVADLQPLHKIDVSRTGMAEKCMLAWETTLEVRNEKGLAAVAALTEA